MGMELARREELPENTFFFFSHLIITFNEHCAGTVEN